MGKLVKTKCQRVENDAWVTYNWRYLKSFT